jgi:hypothetical protein
MLHIRLAPVAARTVVRSHACVAGTSGNSVATSAMPVPTRGKGGKIANSKRNELTVRLRRV